QDVVAQRDLTDEHPPRRVVEDALVDALVTTAGEDQVPHLRQLGRGALVEGNTGRGGHYEHGAGRVTDDRVECLPPRLGTHDHAGAAAVRHVVDGAVPVVGPLAQVVDVHVEKAALL